MQPDLTRLFSGVTNCDLLIDWIWSPSSKMRYSDLSFQLILPTTLFRLDRKYFDITKIRPAPCRILYGVEDLSWKMSYGGLRLLTNFTNQLYRYRTEDGWQPIYSKDNLFPIAYLYGSKLKLTGLKYGFKDSGLEFVGVLEFTEDGAVDICWEVIVYKQQNNRQFCSPFLVENNILEIFQNARRPPRVWVTSGYNLGLYTGEYTALRQNPNPMNRLGKIYTVHLYHILAVFSKDNASLLDGSSVGQPVFELGAYDLDHVQRVGSEILIMTGVDGYSFLTCYSREAITFEFYVTPFQPELWYGVLTTYFFLAIALFVFCWKFGHSFCSWMYVLGALLEDGVTIPSKLEKNACFRIVFGVLIIVCVLLTNCYNGIMITGLNAPLAASSVTTFKDLVCNYQEVKYSSQEYKEMKRNSTRLSKHLLTIYISTCIQEKRRN